MEQEEEDVFEVSGLQRSETRAAGVIVQEPSGLDQWEGAGEMQNTQPVGSSTDSYQMGGEAGERGNFEPVADSISIGSGGEVRETDGSELDGAAPPDGLHLDERAAHGMAYSQFESVSEPANSSLHGGEVGQVGELDASMPISAPAVGSSPRGEKVQEMEAPLSIGTSHAVDSSFAGDEVPLSASPPGGLLTDVGAVHETDNSQGGAPDPSSASTPGGAGKEFESDALQSISAPSAVGSSPTGGQMHETEDLLSISVSPAVASCHTEAEVRVMLDSQAVGASDPIGSDSLVDELDVTEKPQCAGSSQVVDSSVAGDEVREAEESQMEDSQIIGAPKNVGSPLAGDEAYELEVYPYGTSGTIASPTAGTEVCESEGSQFGSQFNVASESAGSPNAGGEVHEMGDSNFTGASQPMSSPVAGDEVPEGHEDNEDALRTHASPMNEDEVDETRGSPFVGASQSFTSPRGDFHETEDTRLTGSAPPICSLVATDEAHEMEDAQLMGLSQSVCSPPPGMEIHEKEDSHLIDVPRLTSSPPDGNEIYKMEEAEFLISPPAAGSPLGVLMDEKEAQEEAEDGEEGPAESKGGKRKRGRPARSVQMKASTKRKEEEDVCFICFDGGNLVLCDRRGCPKAYHPSCVNRDEAFFRSKGKWNCGWHICSNCAKASQYMCYTCTFSLCKGCIKEAGFFCIRGNKGFCETCMRTVMLIEKNEQENKEMDAVNFDDKSSWEYLFKEYWLDLKRKLSLTFEELSRPKNPSKSSGASARNNDSSDELYDAKNDPGSSSDSLSGQVEGNRTSKKKTKKRSRSIPTDKSLPSAPKVVEVERFPLPEDSQWASPGLLEFVSHMKNGDTSVLSQYDVQALLLEYIKQNKLRDPRRKSQIICDLRLMNLFGKARVGHFEMLKLLESHFLMKEDTSEADVGQDGITDTEAIPMETDGNIDGTRIDKRRRKGKKVEERMPQSNLDDYAAIDVHNITLIYLRRNLMEDLLEDMETFQEKVVGAFVRIRISGAGQKQDMYRLVQVVGIGKAAEAYKTGKRTTGVTLEILNLNKTEIISIDTISNQEFSEEECKRLRQSIKCGFINRLSVGEVQVKARALQTVRVNDWLETEILRLSHLRDRASEKGRRKELRECVEKLQLLNSPEERARRLQELPEVHSDPNMDPSHESDEEEADAEDKRHDNFRLRDSGYGRRGKETVSHSTCKTSSSWEQTRSTMIKGATWDRADPSAVAGERIKEASWNDGGDASNASNWDTQIKDAAVTAQPVVNSTLGSSNSPTTSNINEAEKMWNYRDPSGKVQGPFSMTQLRKWNTTGYFPAELKIWRTSESQDDSILLTDALAGKFQKDLPEWEPPKAFYSGSSIPDSRDYNRQGGWAGKQSYNVAAPKVEVKVGFAGSPSQGWDMSKVPSNNGWSGQSQGHTNSTPSYRGREDRMGLDAGRWSSGQNHGNSWNTDQSAGFQSNNSVPSGQSQTMSIRTEVWSPNQTTRNDFLNPPTPTPNLSSGGWTTIQTTNPVWGTSGVNVPVPQQISSTSVSNRVGGGWGNPAPLMMPEGANESFNPPTPTPKPSGGDWGNSPNPGSSGSQQPLVMLKEPTKATNNWGQRPFNSDVSDCAQVSKLEHLTTSSVSPTHDRSQSIGVFLPGQPRNDLAPKDLEQVPSERSDGHALIASGSAIPIPQMVHTSSEGPGGKGPISLPTEDTLQFSSQNQVSLSHGSQAVNLIMGPTTGQKLGLGQQSATAGWGTSQSQKPDMVMESAGISNDWTAPPNANGDKWSAPPTESKMKPSRWGPALNDAGAHSQNTSLPPAANWQSLSSHPATGMGATPENTNKGWVPPGPEGSNSNAGPGAVTPGNANAGWGGAAQGNSNGGWGPSESKNVNSSWGAQGHTNTAWVPPAGQGNPSTGRGATPQGNMNAGWSTPGGNPGSWGGKHNHNEERFSGHGDRGFQGGSDSGQGGGRQPWNRPSLGGGRGPPGPPNRGQRVCKFHENGHCKKGAACDYLHT
ncbi:zinc finger CCCH domain-containing protein 19-like [Aristolochia californica]|uniref:zinc finger CCCH domain-containing protein 19-like n=1 Tax=Aristolochia californica TaxID=171875 RepID=UPI0035E2C154